MKKTTGSGQPHITAAILSLGLAFGFRVEAQSIFELRTDPIAPQAGQPFDVVVTTGGCHNLFVGNIDGFAYGGVSVNGVSSRCDSVISTM